MRSIKGRLIGSYVAVILLTVTIINILLVFLLRQYYYSNIEDILEREAQLSANSYKHYNADNSLQQNAKRLLEDIIMITDAQVQIIDSDGIVLADSVEILSSGYHADYPDVESAVKGQVSNWIGKVSLTYEPILSVSYPLKIDGQVIGVVRLVSSLSEVDKLIVRPVLFLVPVGIIVVLVVSVFGYFLSRTIIKPVQEITTAAEEMAQGRFDVRVLRRYNDEIGKLADTLNYMAEEIANHQKLKDNFIASVSHELRTPLTSIKGWAVTLNSSDYKDVNELREGLAIIENETDRLTLLVDELLDFSKFAASSVTISTSTLDISKFLNDTKNQMNPRALRQGISIEVNIEEEIPLIKADKNRLKQVMINILDNSLKFTPEGGSIIISCQSQENEVMISVEDTGCGILADDLKKVTHRFYKGGSVSSGNGLGLAICEEIVNLHSGRLEIISRQGEGTRINILLPY